MSSRIDNPFITNNSLIMRYISKVSPYQIFQLGIISVLIICSILLGITQNIFLILPFLSIPFFIILLFRLQYGIVMLIIVSTFYFLIKGFVPNKYMLPFIWRDLMLFMLFVIWFLRELSMRKFLKTIKIDSITILVLLYLLWGFMEIFNSSSLLHGIAGFRLMVSPAIVYFVTFSTIRGRREITLYINTILLCVFTMAVLGIAQFLLLQLNIMTVSELYSVFPFNRIYSEKEIMPMMRFGLYRVSALYGDANHFAAILIIGACLLLPKFLSNNTNKLKLAIIMGGLIAAILFSGSRGGIIALLLNILILISISFKMKKKLSRGEILIILLICLFLIFSHRYLKEFYKPVMTGQEAYYGGVSYAWNLVKDLMHNARTLMIGNGYALTKSMAERLGIDVGLFDMGRYEVFYFGMLIQLGVIGTLIFILMNIAVLGKTWRNIGGISLDTNYDFRKEINVSIFIFVCYALFYGIHYAIWTVVGPDYCFYILLAVASRLATCDRKEMA